MKTWISIALLASAAVALSAFSASPPESPKYVGAKTCKTCHNTDKGGKVYAVWEGTSHANAFKTLMTAEADKIAREKGYSTRASETDFCLGCHVTGMNDQSAAFDKKFDKAAGVQCESCHGPGSLYKTKHAKASQREEVRKMGFIDAKIADGGIEAQCTSCHNETSPTYKHFTFEAYWAKIAHALPK